MPGFGLTLKGKGTHPRKLGGVKGPLGVSTRGVQTRAGLKRALTAKFMKRKLRPQDLDKSGLFTRRQIDDLLSKRYIGEKM